MIFSLKKNLLPAIFLLFTICLVIFSKTNLAAAKNGLVLWANNVVPSLLPFFIATELLSYTNVVNVLGKLLNPIMKPIFNVPGVGSYAFLMGIISGYPTGAKIVCNLKEQGLLTDVEAERLLAFTNNSGPLFILGTVGVSLFGNTLIGFLLLLTHILSCITVGFLFRFWRKNEKTNCGGSGAHYPWFLWKQENEHRPLCIYHSRGGFYPAQSRFDPSGGIAGRAQTDRSGRIFRRFYL